uniref:Hedgehog/Intein (Hint) domain-containing protein n=1 Tax=viral metagenome TaxID=1070528 RepID=A0A6C0DH86_9ZZZZ
MPSGKNWMYFIYINLAFIIYIIIIFYLSSIQDIKANWSLYRCNPLYMPLSENIEKDFTYCIQNVQTGIMGYLLQPITFVTSSLSSTMSNFMEEINMVRAMFNKIRTFISSIIQSVFGVFLNLVIEFQKITISIKDLMGKTIGIMVTMMYLMDGNIKTMNSMWNGPSGQMVRVLGKCFHPETKIKLKNGSIKMMKDIHLGDVLENNSVVEATMEIDNKINKVPLHVLKNAGVNNENIYVTGSHLIYNRSTNQFTCVNNYYVSELANNIETDWFCCLITSDHKIQIGNEIFWDWEDHYVKF